MREYRVIIEDDVEDYFINLLQFVAGNSTLDFALRYVKNMFISVDVFNLLDIPNTISYTWVKFVDNRYYGINNYLTPRYVNVKLVMEF